ncbi:hypothetical protein [Winogradskyella sp. UBA3174]|uniref:hypothetical protein n=1 Tax=Winogradskyella sp. UBA3174 TaxID=1947785 RepID=UPI0025E2D68D|nr:hypothetical protein [Winogradskyella sp. UBA3174]|tara:strand:+ start:2050 stop:2898 length:849 start_codon:yes stop_codon:yes gene_type:complete
MKKNITVLLILLLSASFSFSQIPIEEYRAEIEKLETETQINEYWNNLHKIDQEILVRTTNLKIADSISISNMIKTSLIFDIHGTKGYNPNGFSGFLTIINLSHNYIGQCQLAYWPIIEKCAEIGGTIDSFGGKYPAYELESVSSTFYNYSLFNQEIKYPKLIEKLRKIKTQNIIDELSKSLEYQNKLRELNEVKVLHSWSKQRFENRIDEGKFSFVKMSNNGIYIKIYRRIKKLELMKTNLKSKVYRIENEPFGWKYVYGNDGSLILIDDEENELIKYTLAK